MRKSLAITGLLMIGMAVSGASCVSTSGSVPLPSGPPSVSSVQQTVLSVCKYVPTASTVAKVISAVVGGAGGNIINSVGGIAQAICDAVTNNPLAEGPVPGYHTPTVAGVKLKGSFVK